MRIISLLPAATEIVCALGAGDELVAVSHECDWPVHVRALPRVTGSALGHATDAGAVDAAVRTVLGSGAPLFELMETEIARLRPDVIITQALCDVCAVAEGDVRALAARLEPAPRIATLAGATLEGVFEDIALVADGLGRPQAGARLLASLRGRMLAVHAMLKAARAPRPRVAVIEWTDPPYVAAHWVPELVRRAGGIDVLANDGERSRVVRAEEVEAAIPGLVIVAPCGYALQRAHAAAQWLLERPEWRWMRNVPVWAVDGNALLSRAGPRLIDAIEVLAAIMHPTLFGFPDDASARPVANPNAPTHAAMVPHHAQ